MILSQLNDGQVICCSETGALQVDKSKPATSRDSEKT